MLNASELKSDEKSQAKLPEWFMRSMEDVFASCLNTQPAPESGFISWLLTPITSFVEERAKLQSIERELAVSQSIIQSVSFEVVGNLLRSLLPHKLITSNIPLALIEWLNIRGHLMAAVSVFNLSKKTNLADVHVYNRMLKECYLSNDKAKTLDLFNEAVINGFANEATYLMIMQTATKNHDRELLRQLYSDSMISFGESEALYLTVLKCATEFQDKDWLKDLFLYALLSCGESEALFLTMLKCVAQFDDADWLKRLFLDAMLGCGETEALYSMMMECVTQLEDKDWLKEIYSGALLAFGNKVSIYVTMIVCVAKFRDKDLLIEVYNEAMISGIEDQKLYYEILNAAYILKDKQWMADLFEEADIKGFVNEPMRSLMQKIEMDTHAEVKKATVTKPDLNVKNKPSAGQRSMKKNNDKMSEARHCKFFPQGKCNKGDTCPYVHSVSELRLH